MKAKSKKLQDEIFKLQNECIDKEYQIHKLESEQTHEQDKILEALSKTKPRSKPKWTVEKLAEELRNEFTDDGNHWMNWDECSPETRMQYRRQARFVLKNFKER